MNDWPKVRLGEICDRVCSGGTPSASNESYYNGGIPWLNTNEVNFNRIYTTAKTISEAGLKASAAKYIPQNTIIVAMYGVTAGKVAIAKIPLTTNQACCNLIINNQTADYRFVFYYLKLQSNQLNKLANGGAQQNLNSLIIKKYPIPLPPLSIQHAIAKRLSAYDNLIENNTKRIAILERMAEQLYKEWFVRKRGIGKADGWHKGYLGDICCLKRGRNITSSEMKPGIIPVIAAGLEPSGYHDAANVHGISITMSSSGANAGFIGIHYSDIWAADCAYASEGDTPNIYFAYEVLNNLRPVIDNFKMGAAQPHVYPKHINAIKIEVPPEGLMAEANNRLATIHRMIANLQRQNALLAKERDLLLPRLMSGRVKP